MLMQMGALYVDRIDFSDHHIFQARVHFSLLNLEEIICCLIAYYVISNHHFKPVTRSFCCYAVKFDIFFWENCMRIILSHSYFYLSIWMFSWGLVLHWLRYYYQFTIFSINPGYWDDQRQTWRTRGEVWFQSNCCDNWKGR